MRKVLTLACLLTVAHHVAAQCSNIPTYNETLIPQCAPNDIRIKWPNYENQAAYYSCQDVNTPVLVNCADNQYFCYVLQQCVSCANYIPPVQCSQLKTQNPPNCVPIGQSGSTSSPASTGSTYPTPNYPGSSSKPTTTGPTKPTTASTATPTGTPTATPTATPTGTPTGTPTATPTPKPTVGPTAPTAPTPPNEGPGTTAGIPPPPSPVTNNPDIPMPPTPEPTPPSVPVSPPSIPAPPSVG